MGLIPPDPASLGRQKEQRGQLTHLWKAGRGQDHLLRKERKEDFPDNQGLHILDNLNHF